MTGKIFGSRSGASIMWTPSAARIERSNMRAFHAHLRGKGTALGAAPIFDELYRYSISQPEQFWRHVWDFCGIIASSPATETLINKDKMPGAKWFPGARLNFAENLLRCRGENPALVFWGEDKVKRTLSFRELYERVAKLSLFLASAGVRSGDRVAAVMPNMPETIIGMLSAASLGATWASCSPDFGAAGIVERFGQIAPKVLLASDGYFFKGNWLPITDKVQQALSQIPSVELRLLCPYLASEKSEFSTTALPAGWHSLNDVFALSGTGANSIQFAQVDFNHPLYIMFSSGTTGRPKCIVHGAGGTLLEHLKELMLHTDLHPHDRIFYQTTCGWMMWNWLVSSLACGATIVLYDGSPLHRDGAILFDLAQDEQVTVFGTNAKFIALCEKSGTKPRVSHNLQNLHTILSTGSPLAPESFDYVYRDISAEVCLSSISGGTDIIGCFALGSPISPVYRGELQTRSLGLKVEVYDEKGVSVLGKKGELVCTAPFPSMPVGFLNDPDGEKYRQSYFSRFKNVWHHGDYVELTERGSMIFYGRSDAVLNPGGVRIGTAEIYSQVENFEEVAESLAIGQEWNGDVRVVLFVKIKPGSELTSELKSRICTTIRNNVSPFHVPKKIIAVPDIPRTISGKIVELTVRDIVHGLEPKNVEALANPQALEFFKDIKELKIE